jgi:peptide deformylase
MVLPIYAYGFPVLRKKGEIIPEDYPNLKVLIENMFETLHAAEGVGLAAQQVSYNLMLFIIDAKAFEEKYPEAKDFKKVFINAEIIEEQGEVWTYDEGCLSFPGIREDVDRKSKIKIKYIDENFIEHIEEYHGIISRVIQHEYDHNQGIFFIDRINSLRRMMMKNKLNDIMKGDVDVKYKMKFPQLKKVH